MPTAAQSTKIVAWETDVTFGRGTGFTVTVAEALALPPAPKHPSVYVAVPVAVGVSEIDPLVACAPDHAPDALHEVVLVDDHVTVVDAPIMIGEGDAVIVTVGAGTGLIVTVAEPVIFVYPGTVDAAVIVAVVVVVIVEEAVNTPPVVIVPALAGTDHVTT